MAFSSGTFSRLYDWTDDRDGGVKIQASRMDSEMDGFATGLTTCILKDGSQTLTAVIPFTLGLSLPTDKKVQLRDSAIYINSSTDGQMDLVADTEIEVTAPTVDIAASTAVTIATPSLIISDNTTDEPIVQIKNTHNGTTAGELRFVMDKGSAGADGDDLGTISFYGDDSGQNQTAFAKILGEVSESDNTDEAGKLSFFVAESDGTNTALTAGLVLEGEHATDGEVDVTIGAGATSTTAIVGNATIGDNLSLISDSSVINFGADSDVTITHDPDDGLIFKSKATGDDNPFVLTLQTGETDIQNNDVIGAINFQAPDETTGTSAILVAAGIEAVSEGNFASDNNETKLRFKTAANGAASAQMDLLSDGKLKILSGGINVKGSAVFNENGADVNFRVESDDNTHMLFVDGGENKVFIGCDADQNYDAGIIPTLQIAQVGNTVFGGIGVGHYSNDSEGSFLVMGSSRATSVTGTTIVADGDTLGRIDFQGTDGSEFETGAIIMANVDGTPGAEDMPGRLTFWTTADGAHSATERMRITKLGYTKMSYDVQNTATGSGAYHELLGNENTYVFHARNLSSSGNTFIALFRHTTTPNDNTSTFLYCDDGNGSNVRCRINSNGNIYNANDTYGSTSDQRIKQDITDANSQWDDIKALKVKNFKKKSDVRQYGADKAPIHLGLIAQELEAVSPKLIDELSPSVGDVLSSSEFGTLEDDLENPKSYYEDGDEIPNGKEIGDAKEYNKKVKEEKAKVKAIKYSILHMKAVKALQEAMERIETLEAKVKALEDA